MNQVIIQQGNIEKNNVDSLNSSTKVYFSEILNEIQLIPQEYWSNLIKIIRAFREVTNPDSKSPIINKNNDDIYSQILNIDPAERMKKNQIALELLRKWREDEDDKENQKETWEILSKAFEINH